MKKLSLVTLLGFCAVVHAESNTQPVAQKIATSMENGSAHSQGSMNERCLINGVVVANGDGSGQLLSCQSGRLLPVGGSWDVKSTITGVRNTQFVKAPRCGTGAVPEAIVGIGDRLDQKAGDMQTYRLRRDGDGWRLGIVRTDATGRPEDASRLTASVTTACVS